MKSINEKCSLFKPYLKADKWCMGTTPETVNIIDLLIYPFQHDLLNEIRTAKTKDERSILKKQLPAFTPSAIMQGGRGNDKVVQHTGLMQFDIDGIEDRLPEVFEAIKSIPYTLYAARSASGNGIWGLFRISNPKFHSQHFYAMSAAFQTLGITVDPAPKAVASLRFVSYDENAYFNLDAKLFDKRLEPVKTPVSMPKPKVLKPGKSAYNDTDGKELIEKFNKECTAQQMDEILTNFGFQYHSMAASRYRYTRPGKDAKAGLSVDFHETLKTLYSFSSEVPGLSEWKEEGDAGWSCSPITALLLYGCGGTTKEHWATAFKFIKAG